MAEPTLDQVKRALLALREQAVYGQIVDGGNGSEHKDFHFWHGYECGVASLFEYLDIGQPESWAAFERGRDRGHAEVEAAFQQERPVDLANTMGSKRVLDPIFGVER